jgi:hypothetical protein
MNHDNYTTTRPVLDWARMLDAITSRFDAMLERMGWFEESFTTPPEALPEEKRRYDRPQ